MFRTTLLPLLFACLFAGPLAGQWVYVVDAAGGPGHHFTDLQRAVDSAPSGTIVLVRAGVYPTCTIANKGLTIHGEDRAQVKINAITIGPIGPRQQVVVANLTNEYLFNQRNLVISSAKGPVVLSGLVVNNDYIQPAEIDNSDNVHLVDCHFPAGGTGLTPVLKCKGSRVSLAGCNISGLDGYASKFARDPGTPALVVEGGRVVAVKCHFQGGKGFDQTVLTPTSTDGGDAIQVGAGSDLLLLESTVVGGAGGFANGYGGNGILATGGRVRVGGNQPTGGPGPNPGLDGAPLVAAPAATVVTEPKVMPAVAELMGLPQVNNTVQFKVTARPGSLALMFLGTDWLQLSMEPFGFGLLTSTPLVAFPPFQVPAGGSHSLGLSLTAGWPRHLPIQAQFLVVDANSVDLWASNTLVMVLH